MIAVRPLAAGDGVLLKRVRLRALTEAPSQFGSTIGEAESVSDAEWEDWAAGGDGEGDGLIVVAIDGDGEPVGMAGIERDTGVRRRHRARIWGVWVADASRGRGVGRRLLTLLLDWAKQRALAAIYLDVVEGNDPARSLYLRLGFVRREVDPYSLRIDGRFVPQERLVLVLVPPGKERG